ncbi:hypothetical protein V1512DRAFT_164909 [Lipomyces arxii]|uniref:uncharacterized protein n=1 Tax=Lipomyces arxii TaxID=56418 RepID=UPI0034CF5097
MPPKSQTSTGLAASRQAKKPRIKGPARSVSPDPQWPEYFKRLEVVHRAINTVSTFLCARKNVAPLFQTIKNTITAQTKRELELEDCAAIKFLLPNSVKFEYVDENDLTVYEEHGQQDKSVLGKGPANDIFRILETAAIADSCQLLVFEFIEEDLKRTPAKSVEGQIKKIPKNQIKMPVFSIENMTKLITKRNAKFIESINKFIASCVQAKIDPETTIKSELEQYIPAEPSPICNSPMPNLQILPYPPLIPKERKSIPEIIKDMTSDSDYDEQIVPNGARVFSAKSARYGALDFAISQQLADALYTTSNVTEFYSHQAEALNAISNGRNVIVATPTSSGKSLIYQVPLIRALETNRDVRAIYVFPTKALAQDQKRALQSVLGLMDSMWDVVVDTFDGDTPKDERIRIREQASVIFTNPDILHVTILPAIDQWRTFIRNLRYVVVDELHIYNGLFGSHVALIMRRLRRLCAWLGNNSVQFISCSATISNPYDHMTKVFGVQDIKMIEDDGSPSGEKHFLVWNCRHKDLDDSSTGRRSGVTEAAHLLVRLVLNGVRTITFCRVRHVCELVMKAVRQEFVNIRREEMLDRVMSYRGGYTPQDRRRIEKDMFEGQLLGIVATNALELGVDIGSLDAVIIAGFPMSVANLRQQSGRAGRRNKDSLTILVGDSHPVDQHFMQNPNELFDKPNADVVLDLENPLVLEAHLQCAAFELPISIESDEQYFGLTLKDLAPDRLSKLDTFNTKGDLYTCHARFLPWPARCVSIRQIDEETYAVLDVTNGRHVVIEEIEANRVSFTLYEGAIFIHQGRSYLVRDFDPDAKVAKVERTNVDWTTSQRDFTDVDAQEIHAVKAIVPKSGNVTNTQEHPLQFAYFGDIKVTTIVFGYFKIDARRQIIDAVDVSTTPPVVIDTKGFWIDVPQRAVALMNEKKLHFAGAIHAAEHAIISMTGAVVMSSTSDLRTECKAPEKEFASRESARKRPARLTFYDSSSGTSRSNRYEADVSRGLIFGSGLSRKVFEFLEIIVQMAIERIESCECEFGCIECCASAVCSESSLVLSKPGALVILKSIMNEDIDLDTIPEGPEGNLPSRKKFIETIIPVVGSVRMAPDVEFVGVTQVSADKEDMFEIKVEPSLSSQTRSDV